MYNFFKRTCKIITLYRCTRVFFGMHDIKLAVIKDYRDAFKGFWWKLAPKKQ